MKNIKSFQSQELKMSEKRETKGGYGWNDSYDRPFGRPDYGSGIYVSPSIYDQHSGSWATCRICNLSNPNMHKPLSKGGKENGEWGARWGEQLLHWWATR